MPSQKEASFDLAYLLKRKKLIIYLELKKIKASIDLI